MNADSRKMSLHHASAVKEFLQSEDCQPVCTIATDGRAIVLDLSRGSTALGEELANIDVDRFGQLINAAMAKAGTSFAFGRYGEDRELYNSEHFDSHEAAESRSVHMGIDVFCAAGTIVRAPLDGQLAIIANNQQELDYGPMLVLQHGANDSRFYSLYGHLSLQSIAPLRAGQAITAGEPIAAVGSPPENGNWPPHLHFQVIADLLGLGKDFPGVACASEREFWLAVSPSPARFFPERGADELNCESN